MINYKILDESIRHYENRGFQRIESPWTITKSISEITKPKDCEEFTIAEKNKVLVASGEQSFLYLYNKGFLPKGKFQTITPCFRNDTFDSLHTKYFIKNELIITDEVCNIQLVFIVNAARDFFRKYCCRPKKDDGYVSSLGEKDDVYIIDSNGCCLEEIEIKDSYKYHSYDLVYRGIELGSYGIHKCDYLEWIYGTGVAEPRLSRVMEMYGISY